MNFLFRSSWVSNTSLLTEQNEYMLNESIAHIISKVKKKMAAAKIGVPIRDSAIFFYRWFEENYPELVPDEFKQEFKNKKPSFTQVNTLMGHVFLNEKLPDNFGEKLAKEFDDYCDEEIKIGDKKYDSVTAYLLGVALGREGRGQNPREPIKPKFGTSEEISTAVQGALTKKQESFKKGKNSFETLNLNVSPEQTLSYDEMTSAGKHLYTIIKDGLKYRVTLKNNKGDKISVKDVSPQDIRSLVVTSPSEKEYIEGPQGEDVPSTSVEREKKVSDYPPYSEVEADYSGPDPEEVAMSVKTKEPESKIADVSFFEPDKPETPEEPDYEAIRAKRDKDYDFLTTYLDGDDELSYQDETFKGLPIYVTKKGNKTYKLTLKASKGDKITVDDVTPEDVANLAVVGVGMGKEGKDRYYYGSVTPQQTDKKTETESESESETETETEKEPSPEEIAKTEEPEIDTSVEVEEPEGSAEERRKELGYKFTSSDFGDIDVDDSDVEEEDDEDDLFKRKKHIEDWPHKTSDDDDDEPSDDDEKKSMYDPDEGDDDNKKKKTTVKEETKKSSSQKSREVQEAYRQRIKNYYSFERRNTLGY